MQSVEQKILARIYGHGRGWAFSPKDFLDIGSRQSADLALHHLNEAETTRRVIRGVYDYPRFSELLNQKLGPDINQVATALARKFGWKIQPGSAGALNLIGLSTQVPSQYVYFSSGPDRKYSIGKTSLRFEHTTLNEANFRYEETGVIVQAIKALTADGINPEVIATIRQWLPPSKVAKVMKDSERVTDWVYAVVKRVCKKESNG